MFQGRSVLTPGGYLELKQGNYASYHGKACKIRRVLSLDSVVVQFVDTGETERAHPVELRPVEEAASSEVENQEDASPRSAATKPKGRSPKDLEDVDADDWDKAQQKFDIIRPLLEKPGRTRADIRAVADANSVTIGTVYRWIADYSDAGHVSGLINGTRGRKPGTKLILAEQEAIISEQLEKYLDPQSLTAADVINDVNRALTDAGLKTVHPNTIRNRIAAMPLKKRLVRRGHKEEAEQLFEPRPGESPDGKFPLEVVQIDHVQLDMKVVDVQTRRPIETRPWLTLAIDTFSRMIVGFFLSLMRPSAFGAGVCLYMAMIPKRDLLARLDLPGRWPVYGKCRKVKSDNAKEFKGALLQRACGEHNIDLELRPLGRPHYGAYIERMVGNVNRELHKKRGTTHSSPQVSPDYDSSKEAIYTLAELEVEIVDWIVNQYHVNWHSGINTTPLRKWELGLMGDRNTPGIGLPLIPTNTEKLRLDFLPFERRAIHPYGVEMDRMYYHEALNRWINARDPNNPKEKRKFIFRYDPRSIRCIWFWDPDAKDYFAIPVRDTTWPDISWSEYAEYKKAMSKEGYAHVDEAAIRGYVDRCKVREQQAAEATEKKQKAGTSKSAPRGAAKKRENSAPGSDHYAATPSTSSTPEVPATVSDDTFSTTVEAFEDIDI